MTHQTIIYFKIILKSGVQLMSMLYKFLWLRNHFKLRSEIPRWQPFAILSVILLSSIVFLCKDSPSQVWMIAHIFAKLSQAKQTSASASAEFSLNLKLLLPPTHPRKSSNSAGSEHSLRFDIVRSQQQYALSS